MNRFWILATALAGIVTGGTAVAGGNAEAGATKSIVCQACHGPQGHSANPEWPSLAAIGAPYIVAQLQNFKDGKRNNAIMMPNAMSLSPEDMADLAAYFDSQPGPTGEADPSTVAVGEKLYRGGDPAHNIPACEACHGPNGAGNESAKFPALRGQQSVYIAKQLHDYASGARGTGPNGIMQTIASRLSEDDIHALASYAQGLR